MKLAPERECLPGVNDEIMGKTKYCNPKNCLIFFHPDYTVGFGITPNHAFPLADFTANREFHPAPKTLIFSCL